MKTPMVTIIMLNYNGLNYIKQTIPNILKIEYDNFEFIVVDNGSVDGSVEYIKDFKNINLVYSNKVGDKNYACNYAIKKALGEYILLLDNDILIDDFNILNKFVLNFDENIGLSQPIIIDIDKKDTSYYGLYYTFYGQNNIRKKITLDNLINRGNIKIPSVNAGCFFFKKDIFIQVGMYDESQPFHIDDFDIGPRYILYGYNNYLLTNIFVKHIGIVHTKTVENEIFRFTYLFSGNARSLIKNLNMKNLIWIFPIFFTFQILKAIRYSIVKRNVKIFLAFLKSIKIFIINFHNTWQERVIIQKYRMIKKDLFLKMKFPL